MRDFIMFFYCYYINLQNNFSAILYPPIIVKCVHLKTNIIVNN